MNVSEKILIRCFRFFIKIFANFIKCLCYGFHFFAPKKRFLISQRIPPLITPSSKKHDLIPKIIWQTNYTNLVTLPVYINLLFNRLMAPHYSYRFMTTEERSLFVEKNFSSRINSAYSKLSIGAAQADFWRVLTLHKHGGVYMDIDAHLVWPLDLILRHTKKELFLKIKSGQLSNYFIASAPDNPNLELIADQICLNIESKTSENIYDLTGPGVFNKTLDTSDVPTSYYVYTCNQGNFTNEYFQYIDKPQGKWTKEQERVDIVKRTDC